MCLPLRSYNRRLHGQRQERSAETTAYAGTPQGSGGLHCRLQRWRGFPQGLARKMPDVLRGGGFVQYPRPACRRAGTPQERIQGAWLPEHRRLQRDCRAPSSKAHICL